jgi:hypothetical protein
MAATPNQAADYLLKVSASIPEMIKFALEGSGSNLQGNIRERVFPSGVQAVDADGVVVKNGEGYSEAYAKFRRKKGRQTTAIDLQLTDELRKSYEGAITDNSYIVQLKTAEQQNKADKLERLFGQEIFAASSTEAEQAIDDFERLFFQQLDQIT